MKTKTLFVALFLFLPLGCSNHHPPQRFAQPQQTPYQSTSSFTNWCWKRYAKNTNDFYFPTSTWKTLAAYSLSLAAYLGNLPYAAAQGDFSALEISLNDELLNYQSIETNDGNIAQVQSFIHYGDPTFTYGVLTKLDPTGTPLWSRAITSSLPCPNGNVTLNALTESSNNYIVVGGSIVGGTQTNTDILLASFFSDDGVLSAIQSGGTGDPNTVCYLDADDRETIWAVGPFDQGGSTGDAKAYIARFQASDLSLIFRRLHTIYSSSCCNMQVKFKTNLRTHVFFKNDQGISSGVFGMQIFEIRSNNRGTTYVVQYSSIAQNQGFSNFCIRDAFGEENDQDTILVGDANGQGVITKFENIATNFKWTWLRRMPNTTPIQLNSLWTSNAVAYHLFAGTLPSQSGSTDGLFFRTSSDFGLTWGKRFTIEGEESLKSIHAPGAQLYTYGTTGNDTLIAQVQTDGSFSGPFGSVLNIASSLANFSNITLNFFQSMTTTTLPEPPLTFNDLSSNNKISDFYQLLSLKSLDDTLAPSSAPTDLPSYSPLQAPTQAPTQPPTHAPSIPPTQGPSAFPTYGPSGVPIDQPTHTPSNHPTTSPSNAPSFAPINAPSAVPTHAPSPSPSAAPSDAPSNLPTVAPSQPPTATPTDAPTYLPTRVPSDSPSQAPSFAPVQSPSHAPTPTPTKKPTSYPLDFPIAAPSNAPTNIPFSAPTAAPSIPPTKSPTNTPTDAPSHAPTGTPSNFPTKNPTTVPSQTPSFAPVLTPSLAPSAPPSHSPSQAPLMPTVEAPSPQPSSIPSSFPTLLISSMEPSGVPYNTTLALFSTTQETPAPTQTSTSENLDTVDIEFSFSLTKTSFFLFSGLLYAGLLGVHLGIRVFLATCL